MISKELLSEVLGYKVNHINYIKNRIEVNDAFDIINIYELAFDKCVKWAHEQSYNINLLIRNNGLVTLTLKYGIDFDYSKEFNIKKGIHTDIDAEVATIFKACEWILEQKNQNETS